MHEYTNDSTHAVRMSAVCITVYSKQHRDHLFLCKSFYHLNILLKMMTTLHGAMKRVEKGFLCI